MAGAPIRTIWRSVVFAGAMLATPVIVSADTGSGSGSGTGSGSGSGSSSTVEPTVVKKPPVKKKKKKKKVVKQKRPRGTGEGATGRGFVLA